MSDRISSFNEFWRYYLGEHRNPLCRITHFVGTSSFLLVLGWCVSERPARMLAAVVLGLFVGLVSRTVEARRKAWPELLIIGTIWAIGHPMIYLGMFLAYLCAWVGHFLIEHNRPATFRYPLWSLACDFKMVGIMMTGRLWTGDTVNRVRV
jgi:hypothetical protein